MKACFILISMLLVVSGFAQAETFRWEDAAGKVHYGDRPPEEAEKVEQKKFLAPPKDAAARKGRKNLSYETRRAQERFPVTFYYAGNCGNPCDKARDFLNKRGVPFTEQLLQTQEEIENFTKLSGSDQSPTLQVGKTFVRAFEPEQWNSELDIAGYPRSTATRQTEQPAAQ